MPRQRRPEALGQRQVADPDKGDVVKCEECGTELEIVGLDPVELDIVDEDLEDDVEDDEDEEY